MVYNKFKQGFLKNFLVYVEIAFCLIIMVLMVVFYDNPGGIVISVISCGCLMLWSIYDLFFAEVFIFNADCFCTNKCPFCSPKYTPKPFRKTLVPFDAIEKIEKRLWNNRQLVLMIFLRDEEPIQYIFRHDYSRDFVYNKILELTRG